MIREYVYNTVGRENTQSSNEGMRRLHRRFNRNMGILNTSRSSQNSSSFRLRRTEISGQRINLSRDKNQSSHVISGLLSQDAADNRQHIKKIGSNLSNAHRRLNYQSINRVDLVKSSNKQTVQNNYMLTNKFPHQLKVVHKKQLQKHSYNNERRHQNQKNILNNNNRQYNDRNRKYESRDASQQSISDRQKHKLKGSRIIQRHSREKKMLNGQQYQQIPLNNYRVQNKHRSKKAIQDKQFKKLQQKYFENIYQLKSPKKNIENKKKQDYYQIKDNQSQKNHKNINTYYFKPEHTSTSGGTTEIAKTNPQFSKVGPVSQTYFPVFSVGSQKTLRSKQRQSPSINKRHLIKLDKGKANENKKKKYKNIQKNHELQQQFSSITVRLKQKNIKLQQRLQKQPVRKQRIIQTKNDILPMGSVFLPVQSKRIQRNEWAQDILQKVILHLQCLNYIADYTKQFRKLYENEEPWEALIFLSYKKFYIERIKVSLIFSDRKDKQYENQLKVQNPFVFPYSKISDKQIAKFIKTKECEALRYELQSQNTKIRTALRNLYNLYIQKSGDYVNMLDCDNFSQQIYRLMLDQIQGISQNLEEQALIQPTKLRMGKIIKTGLIIGYLNGKYIKNFAQMLLHEDTVKMGKKQKLREDCIADLFLAQFKKSLF